VLLLSLALCLTLQWRSGCHGAELSGYPDEPGHYVTGLMVSGFVFGGWLERSPMQFAERFYLHYPKVALGHWPPVYYTVQATWAALFGKSISGLLYLQAILIALMAGLVFYYGRLRYGWLLAGLVALVLVLLPVTQELSWQVMSEPLLALLTLAATLSMAAYFETGRRRWLVVFAVAAEAAIHTKLSGIVLVGLPVSAAVFLARWDVLKNRFFWATQVTVVALALPWQLWTKVMAMNGLDGPITAQLWLQQSAGFFTLFPQVFGAPLALLVVAGTIVALWPGDNRERDPLAVACALVGIGTLLFHSISPSGVEGRRIFMAIPGFLLLSGLAAAGVGRWVGGAKGLLVCTAVFLVCGGMSLLLVAHPVPKVQVGYRAAAEWLVATHGTQEQAILVGSQVDGEGMLVSEVAQLQPRPSSYLVRASKLMADSDWSGRDYQLIINELDTLERALDSIPIRYLVLDRFPTGEPKPHTRLLRELVTKRPQLWLPRKRFPAVMPVSGEAGEIIVYERAGLRETKVVALQISLKRMLGRMVAK
jgi:hypothetical protein